MPSSRRTSVGGRELRTPRSPRVWGLCPSPLPPLEGPLAGGHPPSTPPRRSNRNGSKTRLACPKGGDRGGAPANEWLRIASHAGQSPAQAPTLVPRFGAIADDGGCGAPGRRLTARGHAVRSSQHRGRGPCRFRLAAWTRRCRRGPAVHAARRAGLRPTPRRARRSGGVGSRARCRRGQPASHRPHPPVPPEAAA